jgi:polyphosphate:AMP phosphotransferase
MFEKYDLTKKTEGHTFSKKIAPLQEQLGVFQRQLRDDHIPVIIVVEGWNASGITITVQEIIHYLDPRGFRLYSIGSPTDEEQKHPLLWRFWVKTPTKGQFAIFARGWYSRTLAEQTRGVEWDENVRESIASINRFERQLTDDGTIIIKLFLHISHEEQKKRLLAREINPLTSWMITQGDWAFHSQYDSYLPIIEQFIEGTDTKYAPWTIIEATDMNYTVLKCYSTLIQQIKDQREKILAGKKREKPEAGSTEYKIEKVTRKAKAKISLMKNECLVEIDAAQKHLRDQQYLLFKRKIPLSIVFEGWDAAGKGGTILRLTRNLNPRGYDVVPVASPNDIEAAHHYLWRFMRDSPKSGHITIFDRSWYGRVLVERVEGYCTEREWKRAYNEINEMEAEFVANGGGLVKCWLEVSQDEQLKRFRQRVEDPKKEWKITDEDWRNREKWDLYETAINEMLARTSTRHALWTIIESDDKWHARLKTLETVTGYCEKLLE